MTNALAAPPAPSTTPTPEHGPGRGRAWGELTAALPLSLFSR